MKKLLSILLFFVAILPIVGQNDSLATTKPAFKNQLDLDVGLLGAEFIYKRRVANNFFLGTAMGGGVLFRIGKQVFVDVFKFKLLVDYRISGNFSIIPSLTTSAVIYEFDSFGQSFSLEIGMFYKIWGMNIGIAPSIYTTGLFIDNKGNFDKPVITTSLLILKIPLKKW